MDFSNLKYLKIPEGFVYKITDSDGTVLYEKTMQYTEVLPIVDMSTVSRDIVIEQATQEGAGSWGFNIDPANALTYKGQRPLPKFKVTFTVNRADDSINTGKEVKHIFCWRPDKEDVELEIGKTYTFVEDWQYNTPSSLNTRHMTIYITYNENKDTETETSEVWFMIGDDYVKYGYGRSKGLCPGFKVTLSSLEIYM